MLNNIINRAVYRRIR